MPSSNESDKSSDHDKSLDLTELRTTIANYTPQSDTYSKVKNNIVLPLLDSMIAKPESAPQFKTLSKGFKKVATEYGLIKEESTPKEQNGILKKMTQPFKRVQSFLSVQDAAPGDKLQIGFLKTYVKNCDDPKDIARNIVDPLYKIVRPSHEHDPKLEGIDQHIKTPDMFLMKLDSSKLLSNVDQMHSRELSTKGRNEAIERRKEAKLKKANSKNNLGNDDSVSSSNKSKRSTDSLTEQKAQEPSQQIQDAPSNTVSPSTENNLVPWQERKKSPQEVADEQLASDLQELEVIESQQENKPKQIQKVASAITPLTENNSSPRKNRKRPPQEVEDEKLARELQEQEFIGAQQEEQPIITPKYASLSSDNLAKLDKSTSAEELAPLNFKPKKENAQRKFNPSDRQNSLSSEVSFVSSESSKPKDSSFRKRVKPRLRQNSVSSEVSFVSNEERTPTKQRY